MLFRSYFILIIGALIVVNCFLLLRRSKKGRNVGKEAAAEREATVKRHDALVRKLDREQEEAARRVELRNKTFEMYEQVRRQAEAGDGEQTGEQDDEQDEK